VQGKPLLYHLFDKFLDAKFYIIGDYAFDQLKKYLETNKPDVEYTLFKSDTKGTCSGISDVLKVVPKDAELFIIWSDLKILELPQIKPLQLQFNSIYLKKQFKKLKNRR
jgi:NDP-sugar pyrophosphorylase family protein